MKRPEREADYLFPSSAKVKNAGAIDSISHTSSWLSDYLIQHKEKPKFTSYSYQYVR
jgi:hypothetical protein